MVLNRRILVSANAFKGFLLDVVKSHADMLLNYTHAQVHLSNDNGKKGLPRYSSILTSDATK